ncbi:MAG: hypothetical protein M0Z76_09355 [Gammaproteobacteria bacterium]|nr:hypothetical protein [Gammaproteobacteria bacterium]
MAKPILVLGRRDHTEAMRVAAGLTIFGHTVRLILMTSPVADTPENRLQAETLELACITPEATIADQGLAIVSAPALAAAMVSAAAVITL